MIETLRIAQIAIVDEVEIEFGPGLNVLTGETGAGKSIVLGALALLAGGRASSEVVREGAEQGSVEAVFRTDGLADLERELEARGFDTSEHELVVHRSVASSGRSRARLGGTLVPLATLSELFAGRVEVSSQHSTQSLRRPETHGRLLDVAGGLLSEREAVERAFSQLRALDREIRTLVSEGEERERRRDFLAFQIREIDDAHLEAEELEKVAADRSRLAHAGRLRQEGGAAWAALSGDGLPEDADGAVDLLGGALRRLEAMSELDPSLEETAGRLRDLETELGDAAADLERYVDGIEADPALLTSLEERLDQVETLRRKYGQDVGEILAYRHQIAKELGSIEGADERASALVRERASLAAALSERAGKLSEARRAAGEELSRRVERSLRGLGLARARFEVGLEPVSLPEPASRALPCGPAGNEVAVFRFAANPGESLRPLHKVASGGELSRLVLALKSALRRAPGGMVLVFDEVDAGVGGRAADRVGRALAELAVRHQVLCITHLPQIAALADVHFRVEKRERAGRSAVRVCRVDGGARIDEIARMAGGERVSEATRRHAEELLASRRSS
ncbi:MAG: DNA repair protein RecN [Proteobacteria bacterium]|nr:DNA repair protein RecN [Pseudomonadota bacterium]